MSNLKSTPLREFHVAHGGRMVDFAGWEMPVQYRSILEEHKTVRRAAGLFDVSHMGEVDVRGPEAARFLNHLVTNDVARLFPGRVLYSPMCYPTGGVVDDLLVYMRGPEDFFLCINAGNIDKDLAWMREQLAGFNATLTDRSADYAQLAVQGPQAARIVQSLTAARLDLVKYYHFAEGTVAGVSCLISRTGYTGEDGFELSLGAGIAVGVWEVLMEMGRPLGIVPAGLGSRDTLRLEAGMPLYGHELSEQINPFQAGLGFACHLVGYNFPGRDALLRIQNEPPKAVRIGLEMPGKRAARTGCPILAGQERVGEVTSGSYSPTLGKAIAMGYVAPQFTQPGLELQIDIRGHLQPARVVELPFYRREKEGSKK